jgi:hypothetical protein
MSLAVTWLVVQAGMRAGIGMLLLICALGTLFYGVVQLRQRDYAACLVLTFTGLSLVRAGVDVMRTSPRE